MVRSLKQAIGCLAVVAMMGAVAQAEKVANPEYTSWSKFKVGATNKLETTSVANGQTMKGVMTNKLLEVTPEKVVIETSMTMEMMGQKQTMPAMKREVPATIDSAQVPKTVTGEPASVEASKVEETITVAGKEYKCKVIEISQEQNGTKANAKTWINTDVPGGMVKSEIKTTGGMESTTTVQLLESSKGE